MDLVGHLALGLELTAAFGALRHVCLHPFTIGRRQATVGEPGQHRPGFGVSVGNAGAHDFSPDMPARAGKTCLSVSRARNRRVFTVFTGQSSIAATSSHEWPRV